MECTDKEMISRLLKVVKQCVDLPDESFESCYWQQPLTGKHFGLSAVDLLYLLFEVETEFGIRIPPVLLKQYGFSSISKISLLLQVVCGQ